MDPDTNQLEVQAKELLKQLSAISDDVLTQAKFPSLRLYAVAMIVTNIHEIMVNAFKDGRIPAEQHPLILEISDHFSALVRDPPSAFIDKLTALCDVLESARTNPKLGENAHALFKKLQDYLHVLVFSPPSDRAPVNGGELQADLRNFAGFVTEFRGETDRGAALVGAALVDNRLSLLLRHHLLQNSASQKLFNGPSSPLSTFSSRTGLSYALGLITEVEYEECKLIGRIRNAFAHELHGLTFETPIIAAKCANLTALNRRGTPRQRFIDSVVLLCMVLWHRPTHAAAYRAQEREWPWHLGPSNTLAPKTLPP